MNVRGARHRFGSGEAGLYVAGRSALLTTAPQAVQGSMEAVWERLGIRKAPRESARRSASSRPAASARTPGEQERREAWPGSEAHRVEDGLGNGLTAPHNVLGELSHGCFIPAVMVSLLSPDSYNGWREGEKQTDGLRAGGGIYPSFLRQ